jgi:CheY-like chemotaxis protein
MAAPEDESDAPTVLIVDDEQNVADLYATWVEMEDDYEVKVAYEGADAIEIVAGDGSEGEADEPEEAAVDAVLLDRRMPGMSGDEVLAEIRERGHEVPVAMVTSVQLDDAPLEREYQEYLTKPVMRDDVGRVVRSLVSGSLSTGVGGMERGAEGTDLDEFDLADDTAGEEDDESTDDVSDDVRETLDSITERLDRIQGDDGEPESDEADADGAEPDEADADGAEPGEADSDGGEREDEFMTPEDIRARTGRSDSDDDDDEG